MKKFLSIFITMLLCNANNDISAKYEIGFRVSKNEICSEALDLPVLETNRLVLRKFNLSDAKDLFEVTSNPNVEVCDPVDTCIEDTQKFINECLKSYDSGQAAPWAIELKSEKKVIGYCGLFELSKKDSKGTLGFSMSEKYQNQKYTQEALRTAVDYLFNFVKLNKMEARCHLDTPIAMHILRKLGFKVEATIKDYEYIKGGYQSVKLFSCLKYKYKN